MFDMPPPSVSRRSEESTTTISRTSWLRCCGNRSPAPKLRLLYLLGPQLREYDGDTAQEEFNHTYCTLLRQLEQAFNGNPQMLTAAIGSMYGLKAKAQALMLMPTEDGLETAGPTFEYVGPR